MSNALSSSEVRLTELLNQRQSILTELLNASAAALDRSGNTGLETAEALVSARGGLLEKLAWINENLDGLSNAKDFPAETHQPMIEAQSELAVKLVLAERKLSTRYENELASRRRELVRLAKCRKGLKGYAPQSHIPALSPGSRS